MHRSYMPLVLLATLAFFAGLGRGAITDADEAFYAESAREMVQSGDWLTPYYNYEPRFQKPVLYYWLTAATYLLIGETELAARWWSALAGLGLVLLTAAAGRRWYDEQIGVLAGAITATNFGYFTMARMALPDLPLTFFITLAIYAALVATLDRERRPRRWVLAAAIAAAFGFLTKGPVGVVIPVLVVIPVVLLERRSPRVSLADLAWAGALFALIGLPWYIAMWLAHGSGYLEGFFIGDNYERFATARFNDPRPWWFYLPVLAGGLLPWTPLAVVWLAPIGRFLARQRDIDTVDVRLLMWAALPLFFYSLSVGKQPRYVLPVLPPLAILLAGSIVERTRDWRSLGGGRLRPRRNRSVVFGSAAAAAVLAGVAYLLARARTLFVDVDDSLTLAAALVIGAGGAIVGLVSLTRAWRAAPTVLAGAAAIGFAVLPYGVLSAPRDSAVAGLAQVVRATQVGAQPLGTYGVLVRNLVFYSGVQQTDLVDDDQVVAFARQHSGALLVLAAADAARLARERALRFEPLAERRYFDEGRIRVGTLLAPRPGEDLQTIVLARVIGSQSR